MVETGGGIKRKKKREEDEGKIRGWGGGLAVDNHLMIA